MLFDMLSTDMYVSYNFKLANIIGLQEAIYVSELININRKAITKNKITEDGFFDIDREYIKIRTTLKEEDQINLDKILEELNILKIGNNKNQLRVDMDSLTGLMLEKDKKIVDEVSKVVKKGRPSKKDIIIKALKSYINTSNEELKSSYEGWIESVMERQGWMSKEAVIEGQNQINNYCNHDLDLALVILKIASINGLRDISWAINDYENKYKKKSFKIFSNINNNSNTAVLSDEVF